MGGPFGDQAVALLTWYVWFDWAIKLPIDVVGAGVNAVSLPASNLGTSESAVVGYSGGDIMSPTLSGMDVFEESGMFSKKSGQSAAMSASESERYMVWWGGDWMERIEDDVGIEREWVVIRLCGSKCGG